MLRQALISEDSRVGPAPVLRAQMIEERSPGRREPEDDEETQCVE
jgi:hypothetical protein